MRNRSRARILVWIFCGSLLVSLCFVTAFAHHDCCCGDCPVCAVLDGCRNILSAGLVTAAWTAARMSDALILPCLGRERAAAVRTLVDVKVELRD